MTQMAHCKFCGRRVELEIADDCPVERMEAWLAMAVCDGCADGRTRYKPERERVKAGLPYKDDL